MDISQFIQLGSATGAVIVTAMFIKYLQGKDKQGENEDAANRLLLENHLSKQTDAISAVATVLVKLVAETEEHRKQTEKD